MTRKNRVRRVHGFGWLIWASICLTTALVMVSFMIGIKLGEQESRQINVLLVIFCILNLAEAFLSIFLLLETVTLERNNHAILGILIAYLKRNGHVEADWLDVMDVNSLERQIFSYDEYDQP